MTKTCVHGTTTPSPDFVGRDPIDLRINDPYVSAYIYANDGSTYKTDPSGRTAVVGGNGSCPPPPCPAKAICDSEGAFQADGGPDDWHTQKPTPEDYKTWDEAKKVALLMGVSGNSHAADFLAHYLSNTGTDFSWNSMDAYWDVDSFREKVDAAVGALAQRALTAEATSYDSGFNYFEFSHGDVGFGTYDYFGALKNALWDVAGSVDPGTSETEDMPFTLKVTSLYEFRSGGGDKDFTIPVLNLKVSGTKYKHLATVGLAKPFRSIGTGTGLWQENAAGPDDGTPPVVAI